MNSSNKKWTPFERARSKHKLSIIGMSLFLFFISIIVSTPYFFPHWFAHACVQLLIHSSLCLHGMAICMYYKSYRKPLLPHMFLFCLCSAVCLAWRYNHDLLYYAQTKRPKIIAYSRQKARMSHTIVHTARHCRQDRIVDKAKCNVKKKTQLWGMSTFFFFCARIIHTQTRCVGCTHLIVLDKCINFSRLVCVAIINIINLTEHFIHTTYSIAAYQSTFNTIRGVFSTINIFCVYMTFHATCLLILILKFEIESGVRKRIECEDETKKMKRKRKQTLRRWTVVIVFCIIVSPISSYRSQCYNWMAE